MMDINEVKQVIDIDTKTGHTMARLVCSTYQPDQYLIGIGNLRSFDKENLAVAMSVIGYRHEPHWSDKIFFDLFKYAQARLDNKTMPQEI